MLATRMRLAASAPAAGAWELISTTTASDDATIDIINLSSDFVYKFFWYGLQPATDAQQLNIRTSTNNGGDWDAGASDYAWTTHEVPMTTSPSHLPGGDDADSRILVLLGPGSATNETADLEVTLFNPSGTEFTKFQWETTLFDSSFFDLWETITGAGVRLSAADVDGVRFFHTSGNIASGTLKVYGLRS